MKTKVSKQGQRRVSEKIGVLRREGKEPDQAAAMAYSMERSHRLGEQGEYRRVGTRQKQRKSLRTLGRTALFLLLALPVLSKAQAPVAADLTAASTDCSVANSCVTLTLLPDTGSAVITVDGTFSGTLQFEITAGRTTVAQTWIAILGDPLPSGAGVSSTTTTGKWGLNVAGMTSIRVRISAYTSGTASVGIRAGPAFARNRSFSSLNVASFNAIRFANQFAGATAGAKIAAAIADLPSTGGIVDARGLEGAQTIAQDVGSGVTKPVELLLGAATFAVSVAQNCPDKFVMVGSGRLSTVLNWTGGATGTAITLAGTAKLQSLRLTTNVGSTSVGVRIRTGNHAQIDDVMITGATPTTGFGTPIVITGDGAATSSGSTHISNVRLDNFVVTGLAIDHAVDTFLDDLSIYSADDNILYKGIILETGTSGVFAKSVAIGYGLNGLEVKHSNVGGAYGASPRWLFFDQFLADTTTGGDAIVFDSTLAGNVVSAYFSNSWAASAGLNAAGTVVTAVANGITVAGGVDVNFQGRILRNSGYGFFVNDADVAGVTVHDSTIASNNQSNTAGIDGFAVNTASLNIALLNSRVGNINAISVGGNQKYGVDVGVFNADELRLEGNDLNNNETGPLNNGNTGTSHIVGNLPDTVGGVVPSNFTVINTSSPTLTVSGGGAITTLKLSLAKDAGNVVRLDLFEDAAGDANLINYWTTGNLFLGTNGATRMTINSSGNTTLTGSITAPLYSTSTNCAAIGSAADPSVAACTAAAAGMFSCATNLTNTCTLTTTAITVNSEIMIRQTAATSAGTRIGVTCNTTPSVLTHVITAQSAGSVTFSVTKPDVNPDCFHFTVTN